MYTGAKKLSQWCFRHASIIQIGIYNAVPDMAAIALHLPTSIYEEFELSAQDHALEPPVAL